MTKPAHNYPRVKQGHSGHQSGSFTRDQSLAVSPVRTRSLSFCCDENVGRSAAVGETLLPAAHLRSANNRRRIQSHFDPFSSSVAHFELLATRSTAFTWTNSFICSWSHVIGWWVFTSYCIIVNKTTNICHKSQHCDTKLRTVLGTTSMLMAPPT